MLVFRAPSDSPQTLGHAARGAVAPPGTWERARVLGWHCFLTEGLKSVSRAFLQLLLLCHCRLNSIDVKYQMWKLGVVFTDNVSPSLPPGAEAAVPADGGTLLSHVIQNRSMQWGA